MLYTLHHSDLVDLPEPHITQTLDQHIQFMQKPDSIKAHHFSERFYYGTQNTGTVHWSYAICRQLVLFTWWPCRLILWTRGVIANRVFRFIMICICSNFLTVKTERRRVHRKCWQGLGQLHRNDGECVNFGERSRYVFRGQLRAFTLKPCPY